MTEGRVTQVVRQADGLDQILVAAQGAGDGATDLRDFDGVRETGAIVIAFVVDEDLRLVFQAAEGGGVNDAVAVTLEGGTIFWLVIEVSAPFAVLAAHAVRRQALVLDLLQLLAGVKHSFLLEHDVKAPPKEGGVASDRKERSNLLLHGDCFVAHRTVSITVCCKDRSSQ